jgi:RHS repeat-associated protein
MLSVSQFSGSASTRYEFVVPPGRAGLQPELALAYHSGSGSQSAFGRGWDLDLPSLQRSTRHGQPQFNWADTFSIEWGGQLLDLLLLRDETVSGVGTREFRTTVETFVRIRSTTDPQGFMYWEAWDGRGRKYQFGVASASGSPSQVGDFSWSLNRVEDSHGNYMTIEWMVDSGTLYPKTIEYTGNNDGLLPSNKVRLLYEGRPDVVVSRLGVRPNLPDKEMKYRLRRLETWAGAERASVYLFDYTSPGTGEHPIDLCAGTACGQNSAVCIGGGTATCSRSCDHNTGFCLNCIPDCCAGRNCGTTSATCANGSIVTCVNSCQSIDGQCLTCNPACPPPGGGGCGGSAAASSSKPRPKPCSGNVLSPFTAALEAFAATSFSQQDEPSLLAAVTRFDPSGQSNLPPTFFTYTRDLPGQKRWGDSIVDVPLAFLFKENADVGRNTDDNGVQIADVNRDGLPDLVRGFMSNCGQDTSIRQTFLNSRGAWLPAPAGTWELKEDFVVHDCGHEEYDNGLRLLDIDGDQLPDLVQSILVLEGPPVTRVWINTGAGWGQPEPAGRWNVPEFFVKLSRNIDDGSVYHEDLGVRFGDVNGDGLVDLVKAWTSSSRGCHDNYTRVYLNNGSSGWDDRNSATWTVPESLAHHFCGGQTVDPGTRLVDVNGDGFVDILKSAYWDGVPQQRVWLGRGAADATGNAWIAATDWEIPQFFTVVTSSNDDSDDLGVRFADANGDGRVDLVVARYWENTAPSCTSSISTCQTVYLHRGGKGWVEDAEWAAGIPAGYFFMEHQAAAEDYDDGVRMADVDGNGTVDFVRAIDGLNGGAYTRRMNPDTFSDLMSEACNSMGGCTRLSYSSSTTVDNRAPGSPPHVAADLGFVIPVVVQTTTSDGLSGTGHSFTTAYAYRGGLYHNSTRQFRGFRYVRTDLPGGEAYQEGLFVQDPELDIAPLVGAPEREGLRRFSDNAIYSLTINTYHREDRQLEPAPHFDWLEATDNYLFDWNTGGPLESVNLAAAAKHTRVEHAFTFDSGEVSFITSHETRSFGDVSTNLDDLFVLEEYINDPSNWRTGLSKRRLTTDGATGSGTRLAEEWAYYDNRPLGEIAATGDLTSSERWSDTASGGAGSPENSVKRFRYHAYGNLEATTDEMGRSIEIEYGIVDPTRTFPERTSIVTSLGGPVTTHQTTTRYDPRFGVPLQVTKSGEGTHSYAYDSFGRIRKIWTSLDSESRPTTCYQYILSNNSGGFLPSSATRFDREISGVGEECGTGGMLGNSVFVDALGRVVQRKSEASEPGYNSVVTQAAAFDGSGRVEFVMEPFFSTGGVSDYHPPPAGLAAARFQYDEAGRQKALTLPASPPTTWSYTGWTVIQRDPEAKKSEVDSDAFGQPIARRTYDDSDALYSSSSLTYDRQGQIIAIIDAEGNRMDFEYNSFGELRRSLDPDAGSSSKEYFKNGNLKRLSDAEARPTNYEYDEAGRVFRETRSDGTVVNYKYDEPAGGPGASGHLTSAEDSSTGIRKEYEYDALGRPVRSRERIDGVWYELAVNLDAMGRPIAITYPDGSSVEYLYGSDGRIAFIPGFVSRATYSAWGALLSIMYFNGVTINNTFDSATKRLTRVQATAGTPALTVVDSGYEYTPAGFVRAITDAVGTNSQTFTMDHQYRLVGATGSYGTLAYGHDRLGNLTAKEGTTFNYTSPAPHRASSTSGGFSFTYDPSGNLRSAVKNQLGRQFDYNLDGRLSHVLDTEHDKEAWYTYDPEGERVKRVSREGASLPTTTVFISDLYEENDSGYTKYVYLGPTRIAEWHGDGTKFFHINDHLGSLSVVTDDLANVTQRIEYKPYGEICSIQGQDFSMGFGYAGTRHDAPLGLYDYGARDYDPSLGRFLTVDPLLVDPLDPMRLNPYGYAGGNPISRVDIGGLSYADPNNLWTFWFYWSGVQENPGTLDPFITPPENFSLEVRIDSPDYFDAFSQGMMVPFVYTIPEVQPTPSDVPSGDLGAGWGLIIVSDAWGQPTHMLDDSGEATPLNEIPGLGYTQVTASPDSLAKQIAETVVTEVGFWGATAALDAVNGPLPETTLAGIGLRLGAAGAAGGAAAAGGGGVAAGVEWGMRFRPGQLARHFREHGPEMGLGSAGDYLHGAQQLTRGGNGVLNVTRRWNGDKLFFRPTTGEFAVVGRSGYIKTYYIPNGRPFLYWTRQVSEAVR